MSKLARNFSRQTGVLGVVPGPGRLHEVLGVSEVPTEEGMGVGVGVVVGWVGEAKEGGGLAVWIGRGVWPNPVVLGRGSLLERSIFVDAKGINLRVWSAELAARCPGVSAVVVDGHGLGLTETRRLQLAARSSRAAVVMLREGREAKKASAAGVRWGVEPVVSPGSAARWRVEMLRCKGGQLPARVRPEAAFADSRAALGTTPGLAHAGDEHSSRIPPADPAAIPDGRRKARLHALLRRLDKNIAPTLVSGAPVLTTPSSLPPFSTPGHTEPRDAHAGQHVWLLEWHAETASLRSVPEPAAADQPVEQRRRA